jgi:outer membrane protein TolC
MRSHTVFSIALAVVLTPTLAMAAELAGGSGKGGALSLDQVLSQAEAASPLLQSGHEKEAQARADAWGAASFYYPHLVGAVTTGTGLAASPGQAPWGVAGVIGSPFRTEPKVGADIAGYWDLLNVSQILGHQAARDARVTVAEQSRILRIQVDQAALIAFLGSVRLAGQAEAWQREVERAQEVFGQVQRYTRVGRYSQVQLLLLQELLSQAQLNKASSLEQVRFASKNLAVILGQKDGDHEGSVPAAVDETVLEAIRTGSTNPLLGLAGAQLQEARSREKAALAQALPRVYANASIGTVDKTMLVPDYDYSASIGVAWPLFEGFQIAAGVQKARATVREKMALLEEAQRQILLANDRYDEAVSLLRLRTQSLASRVVATRRAYELAKDRYYRQLSPVSDLQQSMQNLTTVELDLNASLVELVSTLGAQRLFNGGSRLADDKP